MNMSINEATAIVAAIVTTLHESDCDIPESTLYILCGMDMDKWNTVRGIMLCADFVSIKGNFVTLRPKGTEVAIKINEKLGARSN